MLQYLKLVIWCCIVHGSYAIRLPPSPCPNIFAYEGEPEQDRWFGVITFSSNIELVGLNYKVQLDRPSQLLVSWDGDARTSDNINYSIFDPFHTQRAGEIVRARIMVKYAPHSGPPAVMRIIINGNTMCASNDGNTGSGTGIGLSNDQSTERPDPTFGENEDIVSEFSNNRGQSNNYGGSQSNGNTNYNVNSPNYSGQNRPSIPAYEPPNYGGANAPNYSPSNSGNSGFGNNYVPSNSNYGNAGSSNSRPSAGGNQNAGSGIPNYGNTNPNYGTGNIASGSDSVSYPSGGRPQWSDTSSSVVNNNRTSTTNWQGSGFSNSQPSNQQVVETTANSGPIVTTLTLPSNSHNKSNIDQIVQIIKNQLEQQHFTQNNNKTVIVAVVNPASSSMSQVSTDSAASSSSAEQSLAYRSSTTSTSASTKTRIVTPTTKSPNGHRTNKD